MDEFVFNFQTFHTVEIQRANDTFLVWCFSQYISVSTKHTTFIAIAEFNTQKV